MDKQDIFSKNNNVVRNEVEDNKAEDNKVINNKAEDIIVKDNKAEDIKIKDIKAKDAKVIDKAEPITEVLSADKTTFSHDAEVKAHSKEFGKVKMWFCMFFLGVFMYVLAALYVIIKHKGLFFYYGDYNVQQVPFYILAHRAIRNGQLFWNWNLDLGGDLTADLAFYLMGSPFFWITIPFPESFLPYMMPYLMALKYGVASANAFLYMRRYTRTNRAAQIGALLFAFCGFNATNIVFNHFTDAVAFFSLLMIAFENLCAFDNGQKGFKISRSRWIFFAVMTCVCSVVNYYFFFGQVIFLGLYFILRYVPGRKMSDTGKNLIRLITAGITGIMVAGLFLVLAFNGVAGNSRLDNILLGYDIVVYPSGYMYWDIIKSMIMLPDIIGRGTLFFTTTVKNASLAVYLPMFGLAGVIAYFRAFKGQASWKKRMLIASLIIAFIPVFNSAFSLFNSQYYARWFYMPILIMSLVTCEMVERDRGENLRTGTLATIIMFLLLIIIAILPSRDDDGNIVYMQMVSNSDIFWRDVLGTAVFCSILILIVFLSRKIKTRVNLSFAGTVFAGCIGTMIILINGSSLISDFGMEQWKLQMIDTRPTIDESSFSRIETDSTSTNYEMRWGIPTIHCFLSTVPSQIFDFYEGAAGITRSVESDSPLTRAGLRALLSARYYVENSRINDDDEFLNNEGTLDYEQVSSLEEMNGFTLFENTNYIPMGFTFDYYTSESDWTAADASDHDLSLVKVLILPDEIANTYHGNMIRLSASDIANDEIDIYQFRSLCNQRRASACTAFTTTKNGFEAITKNFKEYELVFFSVPNVEGMTATVDGKKVDIITADYGLMAIPVSKGSHTITVKYLPKGIYLGLGISVIGILILISYISFSYFNKNQEITQ